MAREAYSKGQADPYNITVLDVRTTEEYLYVGHAPLAWNVPLASQTYEGDAVKNPDSVFPGQRLRNGWKNSGLPWTYKPDPEKMRFASHEAKE